MKRREDQRKKRFWLRLLAVALVGMLMVQVPHRVWAATPKQVVKGVKNAVEAYPFSDEDEVSSSRIVFGVRASRFKSYKALQKVSGAADSSREYLLFVGKAGTKKKAKSALKSLKHFVREEYDNMQNYLSDEGKESFKAAKYGRKGKWVWIVVLQSASDNKKAISAIKDKIK